MKKTYIIMISLIITYGLLSIFSCIKQDQTTSLGSKQIMSQGESPVIGTFESGKPVLLLPDAALDSIVSWAFSTPDNIVTLVNAYIDEIDDEDASIYLIIRGIDQNGNCMTMGLTLDRNREDLNYYLAAVGYKWKCEGVNCAGCDPERNAWGRVISCDCAQTAGEPPPNPHCIHSVEQGNWPGVLSVIIATIALFV